MFRPLNVQFSGVIRTFPVWRLRKAFVPAQENFVRPGGGVASGTSTGCGSCPERTPDYPDWFLRPLQKPLVCNEYLALRYALQHHKSANLMTMNTIPLALRQASYRNASTTFVWHTMVTNDPWARASMPQGQTPLA
jgi:hypothetical protein